MYEALEHWKQYKQEKELQNKIAQEFELFNECGFQYKAKAKQEINDALVPYETNGNAGGDGFSKYDLGYDLLGIGIAYNIDKIWDKIFKNKQKPFNLSISIYKY